ncbi:cell differentiation protein, putative [Plasmodium relictum]|uniref:Cell differentiation protein, putative n=1 Tax=Plasmodium relictum TaxID=85471 RepID=A0A1J1H6Q2_PLARL|nr:cell differentiation protein, putative [Plasmodium relictum]CRH00593.1 cell differentiation protein, putative [Plasmodium relictum]
MMNSNGLINGHKMNTVNNRNSIYHHHNTNQNGLSTNGMNQSNLSQNNFNQNNFSQSNISQNNFNQNNINHNMVGYTNMNHNIVQNNLNHNMNNMNMNNMNINNMNMNNININSVKNMNNMNLNNVNINNNISNDHNNIPNNNHSNNLSSVRIGSNEDDEKKKVYQLVFDLCFSEKRENALLELSRKRETYQDIAPVLWNSFGTITTLLQEIVSIYPQLSPPLLTTSSSNRVCNSLALLQCVASHPETKQHFLNAHIPLFLYPFLNAESKNRPFEYLRLTSLGVIGALVKVDNPDVINFLLQTEIIPLCLRIMETGSELSKTVATFIVQKILIDELGLNYICATPERFYAVSAVLSNMVNSLVENPSSRLLKHIVRCYLRLSENPRALEALKYCLPEPLKHVNKAFIPCLKEDPYTKKWLLQLLYNINNEEESISVPNNVNNQNMNLNIINNNLSQNNYNNLNMNINMNDNNNNSNNNNNSFKEKINSNNSNSNNNNVNNKVVNNNNNKHSSNISNNLNLNNNLMNIHDNNNQ